VDPGSAATEGLSDPRGALDLLATRTGTSFEHLTSARRLTETRLADIRSRLVHVPLVPGQAIVLFGSWGRRELTSGSDDDWNLVSTRGPVEAGTLRDVLAEASFVLGGEGREPGEQGVFGTAFCMESLLQHVGLEADTNTNLTRRMLLLLESVDVAGEAYGDAWDQTFERYVGPSADGLLPRPYRPPRFLLNDLVRYWRTICVDFEAKSRTPSLKWASRSAKLRMSRKLLFAGGLLPLLLCRVQDSQALPVFLRKQFAAAPTDRLAAAFLELDAAGEGVRTLEAYDRWIGLLADPIARERLENLDRASAERDELFSRVRDLSAEFERGLLALLFDTSLSTVARQYGLF
jgi:hypothetical protein